MRFGLADILCTSDRSSYVLPETDLKGRDVFMLTDSNYKQLNKSKIIHSSPVSVTTAFTVKQAVTKIKHKVMDRKIVVVATGTNDLHKASEEILDNFCELIEISKKFIQKVTF